MNHTIRAAILASGLLIAAAPAFSASDYLLTFESVDGGTPAQTMEVQSWSFGASNSSASSSTGMATGKRMHKPLRMVPVAEDREATVVVSAREAGSGMATGRSTCAAGKHFAKVTLQDLSRAWVLTDVTVSACTENGMTLSYTQPAKSTPVTRSNISNN